MNTTDTIIRLDGLTETRGITVPDNYFVEPTPQLTTEEKLRADVDFIAVMIGVTI